MATTNPEPERGAATTGPTGMELFLAWAGVILLLAAIAFVIGAAVST